MNLMQYKRPFFLLILLISFTIALPARADHVLPPMPGEGEGALTAVMQAFLADQEPVQQIIGSRQALASNCNGGSASGYPCSNVNLLAHLPLSTFGSSGGNDSWGWTDPQTGKEYALMGLNDGTAFVDISTPTAPVYLGKLPTHTVNSTWRDIKVYANHAFIVSEASGHGMQVFDLTHLRNVVSPPVTFSSDAHYSGFSAAHNVAINEDSGYAYKVGGDTTCGRGLHIVDIRTPTSPSFAGCFSADGYTHDTQCVIYNGPDLAHIGKEICFNANEDTVTIVDVTNKSSPVQLSRTNYAGCTSTANCYTHQGWLSEDQTTYLLDDELDEYRRGINTRTYIWDITDLDAPTLSTTYEGASSNIDHNLYVKGGLAYQANYRAGLRLLDINSLTEVGYFDIYPTDNNPSFNGAWSNFPYFDSDLVIVSGIEQGLFVLQPTNMTADFRLEPDEVALGLCGSAGSATTTITTDGIYGASGTVTLGVAGNPIGTTAVFSTTTPAINSSTTLTLTNSSAALGDYLLTVSGSNGTKTYNEYLKLSVYEAATAVSTLFPTNHTLDLTWNDIGAAAYELWQVSHDPYFEPSTSCASSPNSCTSTTATNHLFTDGWGNPATNYTYLIVAPNTCGNAQTTIRKSVFNFALTPGP